MTNPETKSKSRAVATTVEPPLVGKRRPASTAGARTKPVPKVAVKTAPKAGIEPALPAAPTVAKPKPKLVRDSFTIPKPEYAMLESLKLRAAKLARPTKKSEVLRAGIGALNAMTDKAFLAALGAVPSLKTGRPKNAR
jgi:hypothetical protein